MQYFAQLIRKIDDSTNEDEIVSALVEYFSLTEDDTDKLWVLSILSNKRASKSISSTQLRCWVLAITSFPDWLIEASYNVIGDVSETLALVLPNLNVTKTSRKISSIMDEILELKFCTEVEKKEKVCLLWREVGQAERIVFNKLLTGTLKTGVSRPQVVQALSLSLGVDVTIIAHRLESNWTPQSTTWQKLFLENDIVDEIAKPFPFSVTQNLSKPTIELGEASKYAVEYKWDGIRIQVIKRANHLFIWTKNETLITEKIPEFHFLKDSKLEDFVMDGELLAYNQQPLNIQYLSSRLGLKNVTKKAMLSCPFVLIAFDLLEINGCDLRNEPYHQRRLQLNKLVNEINLQHIIKIAESAVFDHWHSIEAMRDAAPNLYAEGIVLKGLHSLYGSGQQAEIWHKWKVDPYSINAVLLYAHKGQGQKANAFTDFTFAVWQIDDNNNRKLVPFAKAFIGLVEHEYTEIYDFIKKNTQEKFGPVLSIKPQLVFEITFEGIAFSKRHKSGVSLRLPRIKAWRIDKKIEDVSELNTLIAMVKI